MQQHAFRLFADSSVKRFRCLTVLRTLPLFGRTAAIKMKVLAFAQAFFSCPSRVVKQVCELSSKFDCQDAGLRDVSYLQIACFEELRFDDLRKRCTTRGSTKLRPVAWFGASSNARLRFVCLVNDWALAKFVNPQRPGFQCCGRREDKNLAQGWCTWSVFRHLRTRIAAFQKQPVGRQETAAVWQTSVLPLGRGNARALTRSASRAPAP